MHRISLAIGSIVFCVSNGSTTILKNAARGSHHHIEVAARQGPPVATPETGGAKHAAEPTGVRNGIDWTTLDVTEWREHTSGTGLKFQEFDVRLANSKDVIQVLCAIDA